MLGWRLPAAETAEAKGKHSSCRVVPSVGIGVYGCHGRPESSDPLSRITTLGNHTSCRVLPNVGIGVYAPFLGGGSHSRPRGSLCSRLGRPAAHQVYAERGILQCCTTKLFDPRSQAIWLRKTNSPKGGGCRSFCKVLLWKWGV